METAVVSIKRGILKMQYGVSEVRSLSLRGQMSVDTLVSPRKLLTNQDCKFATFPRTIGVPENQEII